MYHGRLAYDLLEIYDGLPTYKWSSKSTDDMDKFKDNANYYNFYLYRRLTDIIEENLVINNRLARRHIFGVFGRRHYLTNRSTRLIAGDNASYVQARDFALPLVIPRVSQFGALFWHCNKHVSFPNIL